MKLTKAHSLQNLLKHKQRTPTNSNNLSITVTSPSQDFDARDYDFSFESLYDINECRQVFKQYLQSSQNLDPFLFLEHVEDYQMLRSVKNRYENAKQIVKRFIRAEAENEINIANSLRQSVLDSFKNCDDDNCPVDFFTEVYMTVFVELKHDTFGNFVNSNLFRDYIVECLKMNSSHSDILKRVATRKLLSPQSVSSVLTSPSSSEYSISEEEFSDCEEEPDTASSAVHGSDGSVTLLFDLTPYFSHDHFETLKGLIHQTKWKNIKLKHSLPGRELCIGKSTTIKIENKKRKLRKYRESGILQFAVDEVFYAYIDQKYATYPEPLVKKLDFVQHHSKQSQSNTGDYASTVMHMHIHLAFPLHHRDLIIASTARREQNGYMIARKSTECSLVDKQQGFTRGHYTSAVIFESLDTNCTRYTVVGIADMGGWIPSRTWKSIVKERELSFHSGLERACMDRHKRYIKKDDDVIKPPKESHYMYNVLLDNK